VRRFPNDATDLITRSFLQGAEAAAQPIMSHEEFMGMGNHLAEEEIAKNAMARGA
jgi:hypothetical protein